MAQGREVPKRCSSRIRPIRALVVTPTRPSRAPTANRSSSPTLSSTPPLHGGSGGSTDQRKARSPWWISGRTRRSCPRAPWPPKWATGWDRSRAPRATAGMTRRGSGGARSGCSRGVVRLLHSLRRAQCRGRRCIGVVWSTRPPRRKRPPVLLPDWALSLTPLRTGGAAAS